MRPLAVNVLEPRLRTHRGCRSSVVRINRYAAYDARRCSSGVAAQGDFRTVSSTASSVFLGGVVSAREDSSGHVDVAPAPAAAAAAVAAALASAAPAAAAASAAAAAAPAVAVFFFFCLQAIEPKLGETEAKGAEITAS